MSFSDFTDYDDWAEQQSAVAQLQEEHYWSAYTQRDLDSFYHEWLNANNTGYLPDEFYVSSSQQQ